MTDYSKLVEALRCRIPNPPEGCEGCTYNMGGVCYANGMMTDAADAIEALQAEQKKTVTQIFGEEQIAWEGRCKDLMKYISDLQAEVKRLQDKLCNWCMVCPKERRKPEDCELLSEMPVMYGPSDAKMEVQDDKA